MELKEAASKAAEYLKDVLPIATNILVEEIEKSYERSDGNEYLPYWLITLSYNIPPSTPLAANSWAAALSAESSFSLGHREYKQFKVNADTGEILSMKIKILS